MARINLSFHGLFPKKSLSTRPSHISNLPFELLLEVFHLSVLDPEAPNIMPVILSQVSRLWRDFVLNMPRFWTNILILEDLSCDVHQFQKTLSRIQFFLVHSAEQALDVHVELRTFNNDYLMDDPKHPFYATVDQFRKCTRLISGFLGPHLWRIRSLNIACDEFKPIADLQSAFPYVPMTMLEVLRVDQAFEEQSFARFLDDDTDIETISMPLDPQCMEEEIYPRLKSAVLGAIPMDWPRFSPKHLRTLDISFLPLTARPDGETLRQILLANEPTLESLTMHGSGPASLALASYVMSNLRHLDLGYAFPSEIIHLIKCMHVPNLTALSIVDLRRKLASAAGRRNLRFDGTVIPLFQAIIDELPLHQVRQLELRHVSFLPNSTLFTTHPEVQMVPNLSMLSIPVSSLHFFCTLTALKILTIVNPDQGTLNALNYRPPCIAARGSYDDSQFTHAPVPALDFLHLVDFNLPLVRIFTGIRRNHHNSFRRLVSLMFSMPPSWMAKFGSLSLLADDIQLFDTILNPAVEKDYLTALY